MQNTQSMILQSQSGYSMPCDLPVGEAPNITLGYGKQTHPKTGEEFFHHGMDFKVHPGTWLKAMASGVVSGIVSDMQNGYRITITYPNYGDQERSAYEVIYSHISESMVGFGQNVKARDNVARCDDTLHIEVRFNGKEVNAEEFINMMRDNVVMESQLEMQGKNPEIATLDFDVHTPYDDKRDEIDKLQNRFAGSYFNAIFRGSYKVPDRTELRLRDAIAMGARSGAYYQHFPSFLNPLGLGSRAMELISLIHTILIEDMLNYLALEKGVFLSGMSEDEKKKLLTGH